MNDSESKVDCISELPFLRWHDSMVFVLLLVQSKGSLGCKTIFLNHLEIYMFSVSWKFALFPL